MIPTSYLQDALYSYCESQSNSIPPYLTAIEKMTFEKCLTPQMLSGSIQGRILSFISKISKPKLVLEIGTFTGYSALCLAEGLAPDGKLHTIEITENYNDFISYIKKNTPFKSQIDFHIGNAKSLIPTLSGNFDLVFLDAAKKDYLEYLHILENRMIAGGILLTDNVLWSGKVIDDNRDEETQVLRSFNEYLKSSPCWDVFILPFRDGISIALKK
ncbi:MAG: O-methyltransferase [Saprospiraceae bacterium]|nr:O-methyltransferase [Saprospiraceae bacterium]